MTEEAGINKTGQGEPESGQGWLICPVCSARYTTPRRFCRQCGYFSPDWWASSNRDNKRGRTIRRLLVLTLLAVLIGYTIWLCRVYLPNPAVMMRKPSSDIGSIIRPDEWACLGYNAQHTGHVRSGNDLEGRVRWARDLGEPTDSVPVVVDGALYFGGHFKIQALAASTGQHIWETGTTGPVHSTPVAADGYIYLGLLDGRVLALNRSDGQIAWVFKTGNFVFNSATVVNGILYTGSGDGQAYALDAKNGEVIWKVAAEGTPQGAPAVKDNILYIQDDSGNLYSLNARTGARRLRFRMYRNIIGSPAIGNGLVYFVARDGRLYTIEYGAREKPGQYKVTWMWAQFWLWRLPVPPPPSQAGSKWRVSPDVPMIGFVSGPAVTPEMVYLGDRMGNFYAFDSTRGIRIWKTRVEGEITSSPVVVNDRVYFGTEKGWLFCLDRHTGEIIWTLALNAPVKVSPVYGAGLLFVKTNDGRLYAVE